MKLVRLAAYHSLPRPMLLGHRGLNTVATENTLTAISAAHDQGADGVEIDVRPCRSGELVVAHDYSLQRMTEGRDRRKIAELDWAELERVRLVDSERLARLEQVVRLCQRRRLALNVELKRDVPSRVLATRTAARILRHCDPTLPIVVSSFDPFMLIGFGRLCPEIPRALLVHRGRAHMGLLSGLLGLVAVHADRTMVTRRHIERWHAQSLRVVVWTVNHAQEIRDLLAIGVDGIVSDDPALAREILQRQN